MAEINSERLISKENRDGKISAYRLSERKTLRGKKERMNKREREQERAGNSIND